MRQHPINLLPASIRARNQANVRTARVVAIAALVLLTMIVVATHSRLRLTNAEARLQLVTSEAEAVMAIDRKAAELRTTLDRLDGVMQLHEKVEFPLQVNAVLATLINALPESVTLEQLDIDAGSRNTGRSPRSRGQDLKDQPAQRLLMCEISGFAVSDEHIATLVRRLEDTSPFQNVNLDFSKTRKVNDRDAREFRLSFKIDLNAAYDVSYRDSLTAAGGDAHEQ